MAKSKSTRNKKGRLHHHATLQEPRQAMYDMAKADMDRGGRWFAEISTVHNTKALTAEQIEETKREYIALYGIDVGTAQFELEYLCSFNAAILGAFCAREMLAVRNESRIIADLEPVPGAPVHRAWDIGVRDDTSIWWFQIVGGQLFILDVYSKPGESDPEVFAEMVHAKNEERGWTSGIDYVPHDARQKDEREPEEGREVDLRRSADQSGRLARAAELIGLPARSSFPPELPPHSAP